MGLLGAVVAPVEAGSMTLKEAVSAAIRDWVGNVDTTHYIIGSCVGPAPFPSLVRDLQRVIGDEARAQILEREGRLPDRVIACVGGGSNAIGTFYPFVEDRDVALIGVEAAGEGIATGRHGAPLTVGGRGGVLHGSFSAIMQDDEGQIAEAHSISAGLDYPGAGPEHAWLRDSGRAKLRRRLRRRRAGRLRAHRGARGDHPGARVLPRDRLGAGQPRGGHGPDLPLGPRRQGSRRGPAPPGRRRRRGRRRPVNAGAERIEAAFAAAPGRAALMPYLMGGFPDVRASIRVGEAYADNGADLVELGVPYSDPLADGPVIHAAGTRALANGATVDAVIDVGRALAPRLPVVLMCYANLVYARGAEAFAAALAEAGIAGLIVPDLPLEEAPEILAACDGAGIALVPLVAPTTPEERLARIGARARGFVYTVSVAGTTGERDAVSGSLAEVIARTAAHTDVPVAVGFGIGTPEQAAAAADAGARRRDRRHHGSCARPATATTRPPRWRRSSPRWPPPCDRPGRMGALMGLALSATFGLILWIVLWALGIKSIDAFIVTALILLLTVVGRMVTPLIPGLRKD